MASDPATVAEAARLGMAAAAAFAGLAGAVGLRPLFRRADGGAGRGFVVATMAASVAIAAAAWSLVTVARSGLSLDSVAAYLVVGLTVGLLVGLFPRVAGTPLLAVAVFAIAAAAVGLSPWLGWSSGAEAARITSYRVGEAGSLVALRTASRGGGFDERNLELGPGGIRVEFDVVDIRGPLSLWFGTRRYRPAAVSTETVRVVLNGDRGPLVASGDGGFLARALGCSASILPTPPFEPSVMASASYRMSDDGTIEMLGL